MSTAGKRSGAGPPQTLIDSLSAKPGQSETKDSPCLFKGQWSIPRTHKRLSQSEGLAGDVFHVQEGALLLQGTDKNERLRQYHDERMVLRGAAFDGLVAFSLCLFWWNADHKFRLRWSAVAYFVPGAIALRNHLLTERAVNDPPLWNSPCWCFRRGRVGIFYGRAGRREKACRQNNQHRPHEGTFGPPTCSSRYFLRLRLSWDGRPLRRYTISRLSIPIWIRFRVKGPGSLRPVRNRFVQVLRVPFFWLPPLVLRILFLSVLLRFLPFPQLHHATFLGISSARKF